MIPVIKEVCVGKLQQIEIGRGSVESGIFKYPVEGPVQVRYQGLEGDRQGNLWLHGGVNKAIYVYPDTHTQHWCEVLDKSSLEPSQFGENLLVSHVSERSVRIGDRYRVGTSECIVTQPRVACERLGVRLGDARLVKKFHTSGRVGFYMRVEREGAIEKGDTFELLEKNSDGLTVYNMWVVCFSKVRYPDLAKIALDTSPHLDAALIKKLKARTDSE